MPGILEGEDNAVPPNALTPVESPVKVTRRWSRDIGKGFGEYNLNLRPAVRDGRVYAADHEGRVVAIDSLSGDELWSVKTGAAVSAARSPRSSLLSGACARRSLLFLRPLASAIARWRLLDRASPPRSTLLPFSLLLFVSAPPPWRIAYGPLRCQVSW